jgi:phage virion morphogenesis protein
MAAGDGFGAAAERARAVANRMRDMTPVLRAIGARLRSATVQRFTDARDPDGAAWRGLSDATKGMRRRGRGTGDPRPLLDTGRLRRSITFRATSNVLAFGTNVVYAAAQQFGNPDNRLFGGKLAPVPPRRYLPLSAVGRQLAPEALRDALPLIVREWIDSGNVVGLEQLA